MNLRFLSITVLALMTLSKNLAAMESSDHWKPGQKPISTHIKLRRVLSAPLMSSTTKRQKTATIQSELISRRNISTSGKFLALFTIMTQFDAQKDDIICSKIKDLLNEGMDIDETNHNNETLLFKATEQNHCDVVKFLLDNKANPNIEASHKYPALYTALLQGHDKIAQLLIDYKAHLTTPGQFHIINVIADKQGNQSPLMTVAVDYLNKEFSRLLREDWNKSTSLKTIISLLNRLQLEPQIKESYFKALKQWMLNRWIILLHLILREPRQIAKESVLGKTHHLLSKAHIHLPVGTITIPALPINLPNGLLTKHIPVNNRNPLHHITSTIAAFIVFDALKNIESMNKA